MTQNGETSEKTALSIVITDGVSGVGRGLTRLLVANGHRVTAIARTNSDATIIREAGGLPAFADLTRAGEIRSALHMTQADVLIHNAPLALLETPFNPQYPPADNLLTSAEAIIQALKESGAKFLVYASYALLYGDSQDDMADENTNLEAFGGDFVTDAKRADMLVMRREVPACVLRFGYVYGPYSGSVAQIAERLRTGRGIQAGTGHNYANWIHEDDAALALLLAAEKQPVGEAFNIVDDAPATPADFLAEFARLIGLKTTDGLLDKLARVFANNKLAAELLKFSVKASNAKARSALGWQPKYPQRTEGLEHTLRTWRAEMKVGS